MNQRPESELFQAAFAAVLATFSLTDPEPYTPEEQELRDGTARALMHELARVEGPNAKERLSHDLDHALRRAQVKAKERRAVVAEIKDLMERHPEMTLGDAFDIFTARGGRTQ